MDFTSINVPAGPINHLETTYLADLDKNKIYTITRLVSFDTRYGMTVKADIAGTFSVFLPKRLAQFLVNNPDQLESMQVVIDSGEKPVSMPYLDRKYNQVEFTQDVGPWLQSGIVHMEAQGP